MSTAFYHNHATKRNPQTETRTDRAQALLAAGAVRPVASSQHVFAAWVQSQSNPAVSYLTTLGAESCSCPDWQRHGTPHLCKHILAARFFHLRQWGGNAR